MILGYFVIYFIGIKIISNINNKYLFLFINILMVLIQGIRLGFFLEKRIIIKTFIFGLLFNILLFLYSYLVLQFNIGIYKLFMIWIRDIWYSIIILVVGGCIGERISIKIFDKKNK